ncbi:serine:threonine protein kinase NIM1 [Trichuris trichiura]|uniref:non-specific serine/threonine protein kinase n=1 Tax=Trichuris trichiura TaxID=36087 RepID=A0A077ZGM8_TRITR|nr:serine:threonine protein kinase NIM1 [Trichuris trichiura]
MVTLEPETSKRKEVDLPEKFNPTLQLYQKVLDQLNLDGSRLNQINQAGGRIRLYQLGEQIGSGRYSKVKKSVHILTKEEVAIKIIDRDQLKYGDGEKVTLQEIRCLEEICHPNVVRLFEVIETLPRTYLVLELVAGGDLLKYVKRKGKLEEEEARSIYAQMLLAVIYLHNKFIAHRDIKPENVLRSDRGVIKLCDFGFSVQLITSNVLITDLCGSMPYAAPELFHDSSVVAPPFDPFKTDLWSLGVLLLFMITANQPFEAETTGKMKQLIQTVSVRLPTFISNECKDMISRILRLNPKHRLSAQQQLNHPWLRRSKVSSNLKERHWLQANSSQLNEDPIAAGNVYTAAEGIRRQLSFRMKENQHDKTHDLTILDSEHTYLSSGSGCPSFSRVCVIS